MGQHAYSNHRSFQMMTILMQCRLLDNGPRHIFASNVTLRQPVKPLFNGLPLSSRGKLPMHLAILRDE